MSRGCRAGPLRKSLRNPQKHLEHWVQILGSHMRYEDACHKHVELETANNKLTDLVAALEQEPLWCESESLPPFQSPGFGKGTSPLFAVNSLGFV